MWYQLFTLSFQYQNFLVLRKCLTIIFINALGKSCYSIFFYLLSWEEEIVLVFIQYSNSFYCCFSTLRNFSLFTKILPSECWFFDSFAFATSQCGRRFGRAPTFSVIVFTFQALRFLGAFLYLQLRYILGRNLLSCLWPFWGRSFFCTKSSLGQGPFVLSLYFIFSSLELLILRLSLGCACLGHSALEIPSRFFPFSLREKGGGVSECWINHISVTFHLCSLVEFSIIFSFDCCLLIYTSCSSV